LLWIQGCEKLMDATGAEFTTYYCTILRMYLAGN
jgi:ferritin-like protein